MWRVTGCAVRRGPERLSPAIAGPESRSGRLNGRGGRLAAPVAGFRGIVGELHPVQAGIGAALRDQASCVPVSMTRPASITTIRSASRTVERRWAMTSVVRPRISRVSASWTRRSDSESSARGRLVEEQDRRVLEEGAGERDALALAAREPAAGRADAEVVALGQARDEAVGGGGLGGGLDLGAAGAGPAEADVGRDGVVEQHHLLRHHRDGGAQRRQRHAAHVLPVDGDGPPVAS